MEPTNNDSQDINNLASNQPIVSVPIPTVQSQEPIMPLSAPLSQDSISIQSAIDSIKLLSIVGFVMSFLFFPAGIVISAIALYKSKKIGYKNLIAIVGIIVSISMMILITLGVVISISNKSVDLDSGISPTSFTPTADVVVGVDSKNYVPDSIQTEQMDTADAVSSSKQTVNFKLSSDWKFYKEYSDEHYSGDPFFSRTTSSGDVLFGIYTMPAVKNSVSVVGFKWIDIDQIIEEYIKSRSAEPDGRSYITIGNKKWTVLIFNNSTTNSNASITTFIAIDDKGNYTDLAYIAEVMTPNVITKNDFNNTIKDVEYTLSSITNTIK